MMSGVVGVPLTRLIRVGKRHTKAVNSSDLCHFYRNIVYRQNIAAEGRPEEDTVVLAVLSTVLRAAFSAIVVRPAPRKP